MTYIVKRALFPPWKAPAPYATLDEVFASIPDAATAAETALQSITEKEMAELASYFDAAVTESQDGRTITTIGVPGIPVHGYVVFDEQGTEVSNRTTLDVALERQARK